MTSVPVRQAPKTNDIIFNLVMVVDGLDELEGDLDVIIVLLQQASTFSYVKLCLSSRPWVVFEDAFEESPSLKLHRFTASLITKSKPTSTTSSLITLHCANLQPRDRERCRTL